MEPDDSLDKYYQMFRGENRGNKTDFFNSPEDAEDLDTEGDLDLKKLVKRSELSVRENPVCHSLRLHSLSFIESSS